MRHARLLAALALLAAMGAAHAEERVIRLDHLRAADVAALLRGGEVLRPTPAQPLSPSVEHLLHLTQPAPPPAWLGDGRLPLPEGVRSVVADAELNVLVALGTRAGLDALERLIRELDRRPARIELEVRRVRLAGRLRDELRLDWTSISALPDGSRAAATVQVAFGRQVDSLLAQLGRKGDVLPREHLTLHTSSGRAVTATLIEVLPRDELERLDAGASQGLAISSLALLPWVVGKVPNQSVRFDLLLDDGRVTLYGGEPRAVRQDLRGADAQHVLLALRMGDGETVILADPQRWADTPALEHAALRHVPLLGPAFAQRPPVPTADFDLLLITARIAE